MPRLTDASKQARRDLIVQAAVRVLTRNGVANTSIADIVEESGLSAGSIYSHFENKAQLALYVADALLGWRIDSLRGLAEQTPPSPPIAVLRHLLGLHTQSPPPMPVLLQFWGEATVDPELHAVLSTKVTALRGAFEQAITPWARDRDAGRSVALAERTAAAMVVICQGYLANLALFGWFEPDEYLSAAAEVFGC